VRPGSEYKLKQPDKVEVITGDVTESADLIQGMKGCDAAIHLVGIIRAFPSQDITFERLHTEATANVIEAAKETKVPRLLHMSALGAREDGPTPYLRTKFAAEELVRQSGLNYAIFRPSLIFGRGGEAIKMFGDMVKKYVVPIIGDGQYRFQPVSVTTVAQGFEKGLDPETAKDQTLDVGGPDNVTFDEIMDTLARVRFCPYDWPLPRSSTLLDIPSPQIRSPCCWRAAPATRNLFMNFLALLRALSSKP
jgi:NADH dehydrogenase